MGMSGLPSQDRSPTAADAEAMLFRHVLDVWFPRSLDTTHGGFLCDFDRAWNECGPHDKLLEFQARQTLLAADACSAFPGDARFRAATEHGFRCLAGLMWDQQEGGWFHLMDRAGNVLAGETKHAHGTAYAIEACASVFAATGDPAALALAQSGFHWLEDYARDRDHRGYFGLLTRGNRVIRSPADWPTIADPLGTEIGLKDANVHSDLIETFTALHHVWPDGRVQERLAEVVELVTEKMIVPSTGAMHLFVTADWTPIPHLARSGYQFQTAFRLGVASQIVGDAARLGALSCLLVDHTVRYMRDPRTGGFYYASPGAYPTWLGEQTTVVLDKRWWPQVEAMKALLAVSLLRPDEPSYVEHFRSAWRYTERHCLDDSYGGSYARGLDGVRPWRRALGARGAPAAFTRKGDVWKDGSHDGRALLYCRSVLRS